MHFPARVLQLLFVIDFLIEIEKPRTARHLLEHTTHHLLKFADSLVDVYLLLHLLFAAAKHEFDVRLRLQVHVGQGVQVAVFLNQNVVPEDEENAKISRKRTMRREKLARQTVRCPCG